MLMIPDILIVSVMKWSVLGTNKNVFRRNGPITSQIRPLRRNIDDKKIDTKNVLGISLFVDFSKAINSMR